MPELSQAETACIQICLHHFPAIQAIYLFGSWGTDDEVPTSDIDLALLLPVLKAKALKGLYSNDLHHALEKKFCKDIDLINLRQVSTVLQKEVIAAERRVYCADETRADEFEMLTLSYYQKLNAERADILESFYHDKRAVR